MKAANRDSLIITPHISPPETSLQVQCFWESGREFQQTITLAKTFEI